MVSAGFIVVLLASKEVKTHPRRLHSLQISRQTTTLTNFELNTTEIFGMHPQGSNSITISDAIRKEVLYRFQNVSTYTNCIELDLSINCVNQPIPEK